MYNRRIKITENRITYKTMINCNENLLENNMIVKPLSDIDSDNGFFCHKRIKK